jgi:transcriptional regulator with XRE-family HTH domain
MLTPTQCKMARAALGWGVRELADAACVNVNTVTRFESGKKANVSTRKLIQQAFEAAGLAFIAEGEESLSGGPGVRVKGPS